MPFLRRKKVPTTRVGTKDGKVPVKRPKPLTSVKADQLFSRYIRERDRKCFFCPNPASQNSHFWGRGNSATRYDPLNCDGICGGCHMRHEGSKQGLYREKKIQQLGQEGYDLLEKRARSIVKRRDAIDACVEFLKLLQ